MRERVGGSAEVSLPSRRQRPLLAGNATVGPCKKAISSHFFMASYNKLVADIVYFMKHLTYQQTRKQATFLTI